MLAIVLIISLVATGCAEQKAVSAPEENPDLPAVFGNVVTASGKVVPERWATLSFETGGRVEWLVAEGSVGRVVSAAHAVLARDRSLEPLGGERRVFGTPIDDPFHRESVPWWTSLSIPPDVVGTLGEVVRGDEARNA